MLIVRHNEVRNILAGREGEVVDIVRAAYRLWDEAVRQGFGIRVDDLLPVPGLVTA